jgi:hypothetical protein
VSAIPYRDESAVMNGSGEPPAGLQKIKDLHQDALKDRRRYEPTWHLCQSFLAGRQWVGWNARTRRVVDIPNPSDRERHTVNVIPQYHQTILGKLYVEDLRPDLLFSRDDVESEAIGRHCRLLLKYAWENEVDADRRIYLMMHKMITWGTAALRCVWDPTQGRKIGDFPIDVTTGQVVTDMQQATAMVAQAQEAGVQLPFKAVKEGRILWEALGPFGFLPPPGIEDPDMFPWLFVDRTMHIGAVKRRWPDSADELRPQKLRVNDARELSSEVDASPSGAGEIKDHVLVSTYYEMPTDEYEAGRMITYSEDTLLDYDEALPYLLKSNPHHGIIFYRYHIVDGRFWGKGIVEDLIGPNRQRNRARSQLIEMKDRNLGRVYAKKGTLTPANRPVGKIMELIEIPLHAEYPVETPGVPVGGWVTQEVEMNDMDMDKVAGLREVTLGQAPAGVSAYAAMALLAEQDERRIGPVLKEMRFGISDSMYLTLDLIRRYWQDGKQLAIVGTDGKLDEFIFRRAMLPSEFYLDITKSAPLPSSPAAEAQMIFDIYNAAIAAGQPLPPDWLRDSLQVGRPLPFPTREDQVQRKKAEMEHYFLQNGQQIMPDPFDVDQIHLMVHRSERFQIQMAPGNEQYVEMLLQHEQLHLENMKQKSLAQGGTGVPALQGGHGIESNSGPPNSNQQGQAQIASGTAPVQPAQAGER